MGLFARHIRAQVEEALDWARVIMIHGASRQSGKTTLAHGGDDRRGPRRYVRVDGRRGATRECSGRSGDIPRSSALSSDNRRSSTGKLPEGGDRLVFAVKQARRRITQPERTPGRFILTGSTNFLTVPNISESLAGRVQIFRLWPLSEAELIGTHPTEIDCWFEGGPDPTPGIRARPRRLSGTGVSGRVTRKPSASTPAGGAAGSRDMSRPSSNATSPLSPTSAKPLPWRRCSDGLPHSPAGRSTFPTLPDDWE